MCKSFVGQQGVVETGCKRSSYTAVYIGTRGRRARDHPHSSGEGCVIIIVTVLFFFFIKQKFNSKFMIRHNDFTQIQRLLL